MIIEKSCGAVVFTRENGRIQYVIIESKEGIYGFPKGHMERGETEEETALREIKEETGLVVELVDGFRRENSYPFIRNGEWRTKRVVWFLAEFSNQDPVAQEEELNGVELMDFEGALKVFQFDNQKELLAQAQSFLMRRKQEA